MGRKPFTIELAREYAANRGGACLSTEYINISAPMQWACSYEHKWTTAFRSIKAGAWCHTCKGINNANRLRNPRGLDEARELGAKKGMTCLSEVFMGAHHPLEWSCNSGHRWNSPLASVRQNQLGCPRCSGTKPDKTDRLALAKEAAAKQGGECLSTTYERAHGRLRWRCAEGHEWETQFHHVVGGAGSWCPNCSQFRREDECRKALKHISGVDFHKSRAPWLGRLELDGFNGELKIAFEYQGQQHYDVCTLFHRNGEADLVAQKARDRLKAELCLAQGIELIIIPYTVKNLQEFITREYEAIQLKRLNSIQLTDEDVESLLASFAS